MIKEGDFLMPSSNQEDILTKPYIPIDTDLVDDIQHYSSDKIHVSVDYRDRDGSPKTLRGLIADVYTNAEHEEHLKMVDGRCLRLDQLIKVEPTNEKASERDRGVELEEKLGIEESKFFPNGIN
jgi:hypothetical protein